MALFRASAPPSASVALREFVHRGWMQGGPERAPQQRAAWEGPIHNATAVARRSAGNKGVEDRGMHVQHKKSY